MHNTVTICITAVNDQNTYNLAVYLEHILVGKLRIYLYALQGTCVLGIDIFYAGAGFLQPFCEIPSKSVDWLTS